MMLNWVQLAGTIVSACAALWYLAVRLTRIEDAVVEARSDISELKHAIEKEDARVRDLSDRFAKLQRSGLAKVDE